MARSRPAGAGARTPSGVDEAALYEEILSADRARLSNALGRFAQASDAQRAASALEAGKISSARGLAQTGLEETVRGAIESGTSRQLEDAEASERGRILKELQGPERLAPVQREAQRKIAQIQEQIQRNTATAQGITTGAQALGSTLSGIGTLAGQAPIAGVGAIIGALGSGVGAIVDAAGEAPKKRRAMRRIATEARGFEAPELGAYEALLASGPGYGSYETSFLGGAQAQRRPQYAAEETPYGVPSGTYF